MNDRLLNPAAVLIAMAGGVFVLLLLRALKQNKDKPDFLGIGLVLVFSIAAFIFFS